MFSPINLKLQVGQKKNYTDISGVVITFSWKFFLRLTSLFLHQIEIIFFIRHTSLLLTSQYLMSSYILIIVQKLIKFLQIVDSSKKNRNDKFLQS